MCKYVRLSGGSHGFHHMSLGQAAEAAVELGAVKEVVTRTKDGRYTPSRVCTTSFLDIDNNEVFLWHAELQTGQVFDLPRKVAELFLHDRVI